MVFNMKRYSIQNMDLVEKPRFSSLSSNYGTDKFTLTTITHQTWVLSLPLCFWYSRVADLPLHIVHLKLFTYITVYPQNYLTFCFYNYKMRSL
jgi:hypothetical protein